MQSIASTKEAAGLDLPDGLHHRRGVEYLAAAAGMEPDQIGAAVVFGEDLGFSEATGFFLDSKRRGYWMTTLNGCSCPDFTYRRGPAGEPCKHQKKLAAILRDRAPHLPAGVTPLSSEELEARAERIAARNARLREELAGLKVRATNPDRRGFCLPEEAEA
jgi:hypothetical protein